MAAEAFNQMAEHYRVFIYDKVEIYCFPLFYKTILASLHCAPSKRTQAIV